MKHTVCLAILAASVAACTPAGEAPASPSAMRPSTCETLQLAADLPDSPTNASVYWQAPGETSLDTARANEVARRLGVSGQTTSYVGESGSEAFVVSDGVREVTVFDDIPLVFNYSSNSQPLSGTPPSHLYPFQELADSAEQFLREHSLLDFDYQIGRGAGAGTADYSVMVVPLVSGVPLYENDPTNSRIWIVFDSEGSVWRLFYERLRLEVVAEYPLRPAVEAWREICLGGSADGIQYTTYDAMGRIEFSRGRISVPGDQALSADLPGDPGLVDRVELVYFAFDLRFASANAYPPDSPARFVQPVWRIAGQLDDGREFDLLVPALPEEALHSLMPPS